MFWHLLRYAMAGGDWKISAVRKAIVAGWTDKQIVRVLMLAHLLNVVIPITIAFLLMYFFMTP